MELLLLSPQDLGGFQRRERAARGLADARRERQGLAERSSLQERTRKSHAGGAALWRGSAVRVKEQEKLWPPGKVQSGRQGPFKAGAEGQLLPSAGRDKSGGDRLLTSQRRSRDSRFRPGPKQSGRLLLTQKASLGED